VVTLIRSTLLNCGSVASAMTTVPAVGTGPQLLVAPQE